MKPTRVARTPEQGRRPVNHVVGFPERLALYVYALHKERTPALLEGLSDGPRARAAAYVEDLRACDSAMRQARLTKEFGTLPDAVDRVHQLVVEASPPLRRAIVRHLPPALRSRFAHLDRPGDSWPPAMDALAARLVRETLRARAG
jgi:hypothetical protein